ncbi:unnamed protein product [Brachionus calyciflorus]|uniref:KRAB-A domain-containing 2-like n=1 Tax=Brachionus calyciflorus TaxID=104777 RepID=A0A813M095_9BILA|nr:unnamed protein product [Brachionus calyciflorus]
MLATLMRENKSIPYVDLGLNIYVILILFKVRHLIWNIDHEKSLYELACEAGVLDTLFARNSFDLVKNCSFEFEIKLTRKLSVRQAVREISIGGGQGMSKCNCTGGCLTNRCSCKKSGLLCNSRCHGANSNCRNK